MSFVIILIQNSAGKIIVPEGRNMSAIQDEEASYQNLKNLTITYTSL